MAKKLRFPIRRHTRLSEDTDRKLVRRAKRLKVDVSTAHRLSLEQSLAQPDPKVEAENAAS